MNKFRNLSAQVSDNSRQRGGLFQDEERSEVIQEKTMYDDDISFGGCNFGKIHPRRLIKEEG